MADTPADLPTLKLWLAEAELAAHNLVVGKATQTVSYDGKSVTYTQTDRADLMLYISGLKGRIADLEGGAFARRRPIHLTF